MNISKPVDAPSPPAWWKTGYEDVQAFRRNLQFIGRTSNLALSPGGRQVWFYSTVTHPEEGRGQANFNSACGARDQGAFFLRGPGRRTRPRILVLAGIHGTEMEGIAGALSLIRLLDARQTLNGAELAWQDTLDACQWVVCPLANPDGRVRFPYQGFVGWDREVMQSINCGTRADGSAYGWPACKANHPMRDAVGILGGYFDDNGVNMMHDDWSSPMSPVTPALLQLVAATGPDIVLNLHSSDLETCFFIKTWYVPAPVKQALYTLGQQLHLVLEQSGYPLGPLPVPAVEGENSWPPLPAFNFDSMLFHAGAALAATFESPRGLVRESRILSYQELLDIHHRLFQAAAHLAAQWYDGSLPYPLPVAED